MRPCRIVDYAVMADHIVVKEREKREKYLNLARELRTQWNRWVMVIPIVNCTLGTVTRAWKEGWKSWKSLDESEPFKLQHCCDWPEYKWKAEGTCYHSDSSESNAGMKNYNNDYNNNHYYFHNNNTYQNRKCRLCRDRDETVNHVIRKCKKLAQNKNKARYDWVEKVIQWEL